MPIERILQADIGQREKKPTMQRTPESAPYANHRVSILTTSTTGTTAWKETKTLFHYADCIMSHYIVKLACTRTCVMPRRILSNGRENSLRDLKRNHCDSCFSVLRRTHIVHGHIC